jgi:cyclase
MMAKRIIPCLDISNGRVVKGIKFADLVDAGDPVQCAIAYNEAGADEIALLDLTGSPESRNTIKNIVEKVAEKISIPLTVGGGIRTIEDFNQILLAGADKAAVNSAALKQPGLIKEAAIKFGSKCVVSAIDAKRRQDGSGWDVYINGGRINTGRDVIEWAQEVEKLGAGEILLTSVDCDGTKAGYDIMLTKAVSEAVNIPVIASGGAGDYKHFKEVIIEGKADAVLAASLFHFGEINIMELKKYLKSQGIKVKL